MYRFIWHIGKDLYYYYVVNTSFGTYSPYEIEALTAEEIGQELGGN